MILEYNRAMMDKDNSIFVTVNKLADFARFAVDWNDIARDCDADPMGDCEFEGTYPLSLADIREALEYVRDEHVSNDKFLLGWWFPLVLKCDEAFMIRDIFTGVSAPSGKIDPPLPLTEDDMLVYVLDALAEYSNSDNCRFGQSPVAEYFDLDQLLTEISNFYEDMELPVEERRFSVRMREKFIMQLDNDVLLMDSDEGTRKIWKRFTDELAELGNFNAMRIKAYACYGGNSVYDCDWKESARLLDILWRDYSFGQAANTLGYIYYYGRLDPKGKPDYEKAFFYFSVGSTYGIVESKYKLADMFVNGYYVARNEKMARDIVGELYAETKYRFENGEADGGFADVAYRMGRLFRDISKYEIDPAARKGAMEVAKIYLLQARFAIDIRIATNYAYGDNKVKENIERLLKEVSMVQPVTDKNVYHSYNPIFISLFADSKQGVPLDVTVKRYKNGNIKFKLARKLFADRIRPPYSLVVLPWFDECVMTDHLEFTITGITDSAGIEDGVYTVDEVRTSEGEYEEDFMITMYRDGAEVMKISAYEVIYKRYHRKRS